MLHERRGGSRRRAVGAGPDHRFVFIDRVPVTLVVLRLGMPHAAPAQMYTVDRSTISGAVREIRPLLGARGFAVPDRPGLRLRILEDLFAHAYAEGVDLRIDGTDVQVRRPRTGRPGRKAFVSGKRKQNTIKTTTFCDAQGRTLFSGAARPGRMRDRTSVRTEGIAEQFRLHPKVKAEGYRGPANEFPDQVSAPPKNRSRTPRSAIATPAARRGDVSRPGGSVWSTPTPSPHSGARCNASPADVKTSPRPRPRSPHWSRTAPPSGRPGIGRAPNWYSSPRSPADHPPAEPSGRHAPTSIAPQLVTGVATWPPSPSPSASPAGPGGRVIRRF